MIFLLVTRTNFGHENNKTTTFKRLTKTRITKCKLGRRKRNSCNRKGGRLVYPNQKLEKAISRPT